MKIMGMGLCHTLSKALKPQVPFDPTDDEHLKAYNMLVRGNRQHPELRFEVEPEFNSVPSMMHAKVARHLTSSLNS